MLNLQVMSGKQVGRELKVKKVEFLVGRGDGCDLRLASDLVGLQHCRIVQHDSQTILRDLEGGPGTFVNGIRVAGSLPLNEGDMVEIGPMRFRVRFDEEPLPPPKRSKNATALAPPPPPVEEPAPASGLEDEINSWLHEDATALEAPVVKAAPQKAEMQQVYAEIETESKNVSELYRELGVTPQIDSPTNTKSSAAEALEMLNGKKKPIAAKEKEKGSFRELAQVLQASIARYAHQKSGVGNDEVLRALMMLQKAYGGSNATPRSIPDDVPRVL
ncbi:MAG TPA: FHA domain-containing protein [Pirellulales bacterium]